jgi:hypothetical protein
MAGMNKFEGKERRKFRRRNNFAMSLGDPAYRQKVIPNKKHEPEVDYDDE